MLSRREYNIQTGVSREIQQVVYRNGDGDTLVLDKGVPPPFGFTEYTGDLTEEEVEPPE